MKMHKGLNTIRNLPLFPLIPLLPIVLVGTCVALSVVNHRRLRRLERRFDEERAPPAFAQHEPAPAHAVASQAPTH